MWGYGGAAALAGAAARELRRCEAREERRSDKARARARVRRGGRGRGAGAGVCVHKAHVAWGSAGERGLGHRRPRTLLAAPCRPARQRGCKDPTHHPVVAQERERRRRERERLRAEGGAAAVAAAGLSDDSGSCRWSLSDLYDSTRCVAYGRVRVGVWASVANATYAAARASLQAGHVTRRLFVPYLQLPLCRACATSARSSSRTARPTATTSRSAARRARRR
jgi:hypothetical protein